MYINAGELKWLYDECVNNNEFVTLPRQMIYCVSNRSYSQKGKKDSLQLKTPVLTGKAANVGNFSGRLAASTSYSHNIHNNSDQLTVDQYNATIEEKLGEAIDIVEKQTPLNGVRARALRLSYALEGMRTLGLYEKSLPTVRCNAERRPASDATSVRNAIQCVQQLQGTAYCAKASQSPAKGAYRKWNEHRSNYLL